MKTLNERRDELSKKHCDEAFKQNPKGYSVMPGMNEPDTDFEMGFDASSDIWREETKALVSALGDSCKCEYCSGGYGMPMRCVTECIACKTIAAFKAKGLL